MSNRNVSGSDEKTGDLRAVGAAHDTKDTQPHALKSNDAPGDSSDDAKAGHAPGDSSDDAKAGHAPGDSPGNTDTRTQAFASNDAKGGHSPL